MLTFLLTFLTCLPACLPGWLSACLSVQVGEPLGPVRALSEGKPGELFVGTTKNAIIRAAFPDTLTPIVQVLTLSLCDLMVPAICTLLQSFLLLCLHVAVSQSQDRSYLKDYIIQHKQSII